MPTILSSEDIYQGRVLDLRVDTVALPTGGSIPWEIVVHNGGVAMLPITEDDEILLVRQYRHAAGEMLLEIPAGTVEPDEAPAVTAARELREEVGMQAAKLELLGKFYLAPGYSTELMHLYLATELTPAPLPADADEDIVVECVPLTQLLAMIVRGEVRDSKTILAMLLYVHLRGRS